jgi:3-oxoacyl-[acyl-carrier-protein] synthase-3
MRSPVEAAVDATFADAPGVADAPGRGDARELRTAGITGLGVALPQGVIASDVIAERIGLAPGWIERRTGIASRRRAGSDVRLTDLAADAARAALADAGIGASEVDTVLVATMSADQILPNAAPQVAHAIGATTAGAMDIGAACTGFVSGLTLGAALIESGRAHNVLVVGAEILSRHTDFDDRSTAGLFGDGAGAVLMAPSSGGTVGRSVLGADGTAAAFIEAPRDTGLIRMDGHETFKRAVRTLVTNAMETAAANDVSVDDIDLFVLHQANGRILTAVGEALGVAPERVLDAIAEVGNTSAASIPLALGEARERGLLADGSKVLLGAVGAGFTWGAVIVDWRDV